VSSSRPDFIFYLGVLYLLYLAPPVVALWNAQPGAAVLAVVAPVLVVFVAIYLWGGSITDITRALSLSEGTVRNYLSEAIQKLDARNRTDAASIAEHKGWL
jgi:hypothetical protein